MDFLKKNKHLCPILVYGIFYFAAFIFLENTNEKIHMIHMRFDDYIPFCEYFIVPYVMWYFFVVAVVLYFAWFHQNRREYRQLTGTLMTGMTIFLIVSLVYPNGQDLRPVLTGDGFFIQAVNLLYRIDTPTNILPSIHVFHSVACCIAIWKSQSLREHRGIQAATSLLTVLIVLSTMFLKQHSILDVTLALCLNGVCAVFFYRILPSRYKSGHAEEASYDIRKGQSWI